MNFAILASTNGTDLPAIFQAFEFGKIKGGIVCGIVNNKNCGAKTKLEERKISTFFVNHKKRTREDFDNEISKILKEHKVDYIVCVGFMRVLSKKFVKDWNKKILNIHPSLLPSFPGAHAVEDALRAKVSKTGVTVHFVDEGVDTGPILSQREVVIEEDETVESLKGKIQKIEQELYPEVLEKISKARGETSDFV